MSPFITSPVQLLTFPCLGWGQSRVRWEIRPEAPARGGQTGGRAGQGNHGDPSDQHSLLIYFFQNRKWRNTRQSPRNWSSHSLRCPATKTTVIYQLYLWEVQYLLFVVEKPLYIVINHVLLLYHSNDELVNANKNNNLKSFSFDSRTWCDIIYFFTASFNLKYVSSSSICCKSSLKERNV